MTIILNSRINIARAFRMICFILGFLCGIDHVNAATKDSVFIKNDSAPVVLREPAPLVQQEIYADEDWKYVTRDGKSSSEESFFGRLWQDIIEGLFEDADAPDWDAPDAPRSASINWFTWFIIIIGVGLLVFFIIKATGAGGNTVFRGKSKRKETIDATLEDVDIHAIDYDAEISGAKARHDYRFAVRLWFLRSLKEMADLKMIDWKMDKTNSDYYYELGGTPVQQQFGKVSLLYDYIWYGDFKINELRYRDAERDLADFHARIRKEEEKK